MLLTDLRSGWRLRRGDIGTDSGRRHGDLDVARSVTYIEDVYCDYLTYAGIDRFSGTLCEIGPGDNFGVALLAMHQRLNAEDGALADRIRLTYLDDITSKKELNALTSYSLRLIEPTPAVVSRAFSRIFTRLSSPALLLDIGGATTDVHFTKELLDEERISGTLTNYPAVARYVYTGFGVFASRSSTLQAFVHHPRCIDFLAGLYGDASREIYLDLLDGKASDRLLFEACILLALCGASALDSDDHAGSNH